MEIHLKKVKSITLFCIIGLWYLATPALAQISHSTPGSLKAETRKNKKAAATYEADHKESHLNVADISYKRGASGRKVVAVEEEPIDYNYDKEINALYESPRKEEKKRKKLLKEKKRSKH
jgi:hypothetical protein